MATIKLTNVRIISAEEFYNNGMILKCEATGRDVEAIRDEVEKELGVKICTEKSGAYIFKVVTFRNIKMLDNAGEAITLSDFNEGDRVIMYIRAEMTEKNGSNYLSYYVNWIMRVDNAKKSEQSDKVQIFMRSTLGKSLISLIERVVTYEKNEDTKSVEECEKMIGVYTQFLNYLSQGNFVYDKEDHACGIVNKEKNERLYWHEYYQNNECEK